MTTDQEAENVAASVLHLMTQRGIDAREWERQAKQWEARWQAVTGERDEIRAENTRLCNVIGALEHERDDADTYASEQVWAREGAEKRLVELRAALDDLYGAVLNDMTVRDLPHRWAPDSAMARAAAALTGAAGEGV